MILKISSGIAWVCEAVCVVLSKMRTNRAHFHTLSIETAKHQGYYFTHQIDVIRQQAADSHQNDARVDDEKYWHGCQGNCHRYPAAVGLESRRNVRG